MLKQRIITALVLAPLVILGILFLSTPVFSVFFALVTLAGAWEWGGLFKSPGRTSRVLFSAIVVICMLLLWQLFIREPQTTVVVFAVAFAWWCLAFLCILLYPRFSDIWNNQFVKAIAGLLVLVPSWLAVTCLHASPSLGPVYVLFMAFLIWFADSGAYFGGRLWGNKKLAPRVSPGKTWEGVFSALAVIGFYALAAGYFMKPDDAQNSWLLVFFGLSLVTLAFSVLGDLAESMFKRQANIKDSGSILPGHGGFLDRIDSVTAAAPVFVLGLWLWEGLELQPVLIMQPVVKGVLP